MVLPPGQRAAGGGGGDVAGDQCVRYRPDHSPLQVDVQNRQRRQGTVIQQLQRRVHTRHRANDCRAFARKPASQFPRKKIIVLDHQNTPAPQGACAPELP